MPIEKNSGNLLYAPRIYIYIHTDTQIYIYIYIYIYTHGGTCGVKVTIVRNEHNDQSSRPG